MNIKKAYESLGNNKSQRFWRAFLIFALFCALLAYGFKSDAINITINKTFSSESK